MSIHTDFRNLVERVRERMVPGASLGAVAADLGLSILEVKRAALIARYADEKLLTKLLHSKIGATRVYNHYREAAAAGLSREEANESALDLPTSVGPGYVKTVRDHSFLAVARRHADEAGRSKDWKFITSRFFAIQKKSAESRAKPPHQMA